MEQYSRILVFTLFSQLHLNYNQIVYLSVSYRFCQFLIDWIISSKIWDNFWTLHCFCQRQYKKISHSSLLWKDGGEHFFFCGGGGGPTFVYYCFLYIAISWELITLFSSNIADIIVIILVEGDSTKKNHSKFLLLCWGSFCGILRPFWHILLNVLKIAWSFLVKLTTNILGITVMVTTLYFFKVCLCLLELDLVYFLAYFW